jgi:hypothetical protein
MKGVVNIVIILLVLLGVAYGGTLVAIPSAAKSQGFDSPLSPASVYGRFSSLPPNSTLGAGVTVTRVTSAANNVVTADVAYADGGKGKATFTVSPHADGSHVDVKLERDLGLNPIDHIQGMNGAPVAPAAAVFFPAVTTDVTHPTDNDGPIDSSSWHGLSYEVTQVQPQQFLYNEYCSPQEATEIKEAVRQSLEFVGIFIQRNHLQQAGNPIAVETGWNPSTHQYCFQIGVPFTGTPPAHIYAGGIKIGQSPSGQAMRVHYAGDEAQILPTYNQMELAMWAAHIQADKSFEVYYDDPTTDAGSQNRDIYYVFQGDAAALQRIAPSAGAPPPAPQSSAAAAATTSATTTPATTTDTSTTSSTATTH